jgi:hypothetical protein
MTTTKFPLEQMAYTKGGVTLRNVGVDSGAVERAIGGIRRVLVVLEQNPPAGTTVLSGTPIDVVVADADTLPLNILTGVDQVWQQKTIGDVAQVVRNDPQILNILENNDTSATMSESDKAAMVALGGKLGIAVDSKSAASLDSAITAARGAHLLASG